MKEFFSKFKSFVLNMPSSFSKMSILKKTYVILWTLSLSLIFVIIGMVSGLRNDLDSSKNKSDKIQIVSNRSAEDKISLLENSKKPKEVKKSQAAKSSKDKTKYFIQAKEDAKEGTNNIEKNHFYSIKFVEALNKNKGLFNFDSFYAKGFNEEKVKAKNDKVSAVNSSKVTLSLKELYNDSTNDIKNYDLANPIAGKGFALYSAKHILTKKGKIANNATAAIGGLFLLGITASIIVTVIESRRVKKAKGGTK